LPWWAKKAELLTIKKTNSNKIALNFRQTRTEHLDAELAQSDEATAATGTGALFANLMSFGAMKIAAMAIVAIGVLGLLSLLVLRGQTVQMTTLYADLDLREASQMTEQLDHAHVAYQIQSQGTQLLVAADAVASTRMMLARSGLPSGGIVGNEIFDRSDSLTATQAQQALNETRALEGELARTIGAISGVRGARVHLVMPRREPFARSEREAQASVMLSMAGAARVDRESIQAILNLIAAAVPGLRPQNIALIDNHGAVLARPGQNSATLANANNTEELRHSIELRIARGVEEMLESTLGSGRVRAEATIDMAFEQIHETQEKFDPDGQVTRSQQTNSDNTRSNEQNTSVTIQNNLPNADTAATPSSSQTTHQEETTNYEIGKTVKTIVNEQPQIRRLSVAVMVDGSSTRQPSGTIDWQQRTPEELTRITTLVKTAVGFDEKRGDQVEVVGMRFSEIDAAVEPRPVGPFGLEKPDIIRLAESGLIGIISIVALLLVGRPMALGLSRSTDSSIAALVNGNRATDPNGLSDETAMGPFGANGGDTARLTSGDHPALMGPDNFVNVSNVEGQMRASMLRQITQLAEQHPEETLSLIRSWMQEGEAV
jgi:flagellar M-ring protein FliF